MLALALDAEGSLGGTTARTCLTERAEWRLRPPQLKSVLALRARTVCVQMEPSQCEQHQLFSIKHLAETIFRVVRGMATHVHG